MKPITIWLMWVEDKERKTAEWQHNHIEDGHSDREAPFAHSSWQVKRWTGQKWQRKHAHLNSHGVVVLNETA